MAARLLRVVAGALVLGSYVHAAGHAAPAARLTGVSTKTESPGTTVVIETTEPVAYVATQPDPLTLLVDLRNVSLGDVRPDRASGAVAHVAIESATGADGAELARVRMLLAKPATPQIRSRRNSIVVQFGGSAVPADSPSPTPVSIDPREPGALLEKGAAAVGARPRVPETATEPRAETGAGAANPKPVAADVNPAAFDSGPVSADQKVAGAEPKSVTATAQPAAAEPKPARPEPKPVSTATKPAAAAPKPVVAESAPAAAEQKAAPAAQPIQQPKPTVQKPAQRAGGEGDRQYTGHPVTFDFYQADLRSVLRTFSDISGLNIVIDPTVPAGTVDVSLREVPWDQALDVILRSHQLGFVLEHSVVRIAPLKSLAQEEQERQKLAEAQAMGGQLKVFTRTLSYAKAADVAKLLKDTRVISSRGTALVDERTNTLIINDLPEAVAECDALIGTLDRSEPQVEIEAKIVQTGTETARALGVQWGVSGRMASELANTAPVVFPAQSSVTGRTRAEQGEQAGARNTLPSAVNLPAVGATSALGISLGTLTGSFNLDVALSAMERKGQGKILSQPKVMMQNNFEAEMTQGVQIPIQTVSNNTVTVTFKDAALTLKVKPQITASNTVMMAITLENASPDYSRQVNGIPPIDTQRAITQVLVQDAETTVIGGIMKSQETSGTDGVPYLSRIPLLGWLFRRETMSGDLRELLIFITPRIRR